MRLEILKPFTVLLKIPSTIETYKVIPMWFGLSHIVQDKLTAVQMLAFLHILWTSFLRYSINHICKTKFSFQPFFCVHNLLNGFHNKRLNTLYDNTNTLCVRVYAVSLVQPRISCDAFEKKRIKIKIVTIGKIGIDLIKLESIVKTQVPGSPHTGKDDATASFLEADEDLIKVVVGLCRIKTAQSIVCTKLNEYDLRISC